MIYREYKNAEREIENKEMSAFAEYAHHRIIKNKYEAK